MLRFICVGSRVSEVGMTSPPDFTIWTGQETNMAASGKAAIVLVHLIWPLPVFFRKILAKYVTDKLISPC